MPRNSTISYEQKNSKLTIEDKHVATESPEEGAINYTSNTVNRFEENTDETIGRTIN